MRTASFASTSLMSLPSWELHNTRGGGGRSSSRGGGGAQQEELRTVHDEQPD